MLDIEKAKQKLKDLYAYICEDTFIYPKEEAIKVFEMYDFNNEAVEIFTVENYYDYDDDFDDMEKEDSLVFNDSEDAIDYLSDFSEEHEFVIDLPEKIANKIMSDEFKTEIFSGSFTPIERKHIIKMLFDGAIKYCDHPLIEATADRKMEIKNFVSRCSTDEFIFKLINDDDFSEFIFNLYSVIFFEKTEEQSEETCKIQSINDLIREKFSYIHNKNISIGTVDSNSILIILKYLNNEVSSSSMNDMYKDELGGFKIQDICSKNYVKIIMITDYLRACELKYKEFGELDELDKKYLDFIDRNDIKEILERFNKDNDFAFNMIREFLELNLYCSEETKRSCKNVKQIKKINPLYKLDFMNKDN